MKIKQYPSQSELKELFEYRDGNLYWKESKKGTRGKSKIAGYKSTTDEYIYICVNYNRFKANRLIWIYHNGDIPNDMYIDHINRIKDDDRIENLRLATSSSNQLNRQAKNIRFRKDRKKWQSYFNLDGKYISKHFDTEQEAIRWIEEKKSEIFKSIA